MTIFLSMLRKSIPCALTLLALAGGALRAQEYSFRSFGTAEGLSNLAVRRIYQDHVGFLWVSTENGIYRYDGDRFEAFGPAQGIPSSSGATFGDAPDGSLLVGGDFGLYHLSGNRFEKIPGPFKTIPWAAAIQSDGKGRTFLGTDAGLVELYSEPGQQEFAMHSFPQPQGTSGPGVFGILVDGDVLWYGCGLELCRMDARGTQVFGQEIGLPGHELQTILKDSDGNLWVRVRNLGIYVWPIGNPKFQRPSLPFSYPIMGAALSVDRGGRILFNSTQGLLIGDAKGWHLIDRSAGLRGTVYSAFEDRQHSLWIGMAGRGLVQWRGYREWESYSTESGLTSDLVYEILPGNDGSLLVGTEAGLFHGERRPSGISFKGVKGLVGFAVHCLRRAPNGDLWIGTEARGAARIDARTGKPEWFGERQGLIGKLAYTLRFDREKRLWVATDAGLFMATAPYRKFSRIAQLPSTRMWAIAEGTDGTVWAGGVGGLFEFAGGKWKTLTRADGLSNTEVLSLGAGPNGVVWVGYRFGGGIDRVHPQAGGIAIEKGVQRSGSDGLVYFLDFDATGRLWAGTERGVDVWDGARWSHYDTNDGLVSDDCNLNAFAAEPDGTVWIGTSAGLSRFKPVSSLAPNAPIEVVFTRLAMGQKDVSGLRNPSFGSHDNSLVARYSALNATRENGVVFRYRLEGAASSWIETSQRELQFAKLAPGKYLLEIEARESDGDWSGHGAVFPFRILTPWYSTWWFISLCILIPLSVAAGVMRLRFLGAQRRERELVRLVAEKTADLSRANEELSRLSFTDPLTGLANRRVFNQTLEKECIRITRTGASLSLLSIDVDHFKALNDSQGHQRGDEYLVLVGAEFLKVARRQIDVVARVGGEEFAIILPVTGTSDAMQVAELVRQAIAALRLPHPASSVAPYLTVSVGVATATKDCFCTREALAAAADQALYAAKRAGRNRVCVASTEAVTETAPTMLDAS
jgi:diguanylate cyclase (GGDEF)-like protein